MDVRFCATNKATFETEPPEIIDGQIVALMDADAWFYDMRGERHPVTGQIVYDTLPTKDDLANKMNGTIVIVPSGDDQGMYLWNQNELNLISSKIPEEAIRAKQDQRGQTIDSTYIKQITIDDATALLKIVRGNDTTESIDVHSQCKLIVTSSATKIEPATASGRIYLNEVCGTSVRSSLELKGRDGAELSCDGEGRITITSKWQQNSAESDGYVSASAGHTDEVWGTDDEGNPGWRQMRINLPVIEGLVPGTYTKVTVNDQGLVTSGESATTLADYGITDAVPNKQLPDSADLSALADVGIYSADSGNTITDKPETIDGFSLVVQKAGPSIIQELTSEDGTAYKRVISGSVISPWKPAGASVQWTRFSPE